MGPQFLFDFGCLRYVHTYIYIYNLDIPKHTFRCSILLGARFGIKRSFHTKVFETCWGWKPESAHHILLPLHLGSRHARVIPDLEMSTFSICAGLRKIAPVCTELRSLCAPELRLRNVEVGKDSQDLEKIGRASKGSPSRPLQGQKTARHTRGSKNCSLRQIPLDFTKRYTNSHSTTKERSLECSGIIYLIYAM